MELVKEKQDDTCKYCGLRTVNEKFRMELVILGNVEFRLCDDCLEQSDFL